MELFELLEKLDSLLSSCLQLFKLPVALSKKPETTGELPFPYLQKIKQTIKQVSLVTCSFLNLWIKLSKKPEITEEPLS